MNDPRSAAQFMDAYSVYCVRKFVPVARTPDIADASGVLNLAEENIETLTEEWATARTALAREELAALSQLALGRLSIKKPIPNAAAKARAAARKPK